MSLKRLVFLCSMLLIILLLGLGSVFAMRPPYNTQAPAPTLVPPTLVPQPPSNTQEMLPTTSAVARIKEAGVVNVGILYNQPPFGELNIRGDIIGYDADLARSMAQTWGVEINFVQVTRQPERLAQLLRTGTVDMLVAALVHQRGLDKEIEFSHTYYLGRQSVIVRRDDPAQTPNDLANRRLGVVIASSGEATVNRWLQRTSFGVELRTYLTLDRAYTALALGEIDGLVDSDYRLRQVALQNLDAGRILSIPIELEPFAIAFVRQDASMRDLVNRTLQHLTNTGRMNEIHQAYFPGETNTAITVWKNLGDPPTPSQYEANIPFPSRYIVPRIQAGETIRVAGISGTPTTESERRIETFYRELMIQITSRWGVSVEFIPSTTENALELVVNGQADIAVGIEPDWAWANRVDFTLPYFWRGDRLMVRSDANIRGFNELRGAKVIVPENQPNASERASAVASTINATIEAISQPESELANALFNDELRARAVFGDSVMLLPHVQAYPDRLQLTLTDDGSAARWYSPSYRTGQNFAPRQFVLAVPRNDIDFSLLVEYTLQEVMREGILNTLLQPVMQERDIPRFEIWPGSSVFLGFTLNR